MQQRRQQHGGAHRCRHGGSLPEARAPDGIQTGRAHGWSPGLCRPTISSVVHVWHVADHWARDLAALQVSCTFDLKVPSRRRGDVHSLLAMVNEKMWCGHFDLWSEESLPMFRHVLLLRGCGPTGGQVEDLIEIAITECERF